MQSRHSIVLQLRTKECLHSLQTTLATSAKQKSIGIVLNIFVFIDSGIAITTFNTSVAYCVFA